MEKETPTTSVKGPPLNQPTILRKLTKNTSTSQKNSVKLVILNCLKIHKQLL